MVEKRLARMLMAGKFHTSLEFLEAHLGGDLSKALAAEQKAVFLYDGPVLAAAAARASTLSELPGLPVSLLRHIP
jgi:hypothetical protein